MRPVQYAVFTVSGLLLASAVVLGLTGSLVTSAPDTEVGRDAVEAIWDTFAGQYAVAALIVGAIAFVIGYFTWRYRRNQLDLQGNPAR